MGRKNSSSGVTALLVVLAVVGWVMAEAYRYVVQNLALLAGAAAIIGGIVVLYLALSRRSSRSSIAVLNAAAPPPTPRTSLADPKSKSAVRTGQSASGAARWIEEGRAVDVQGIRISAGLFYLGEFVALEAGRYTDQYAVNPRLRIKSNTPDVAGDSMPYWPSYGEITPSARLAFLKWMAENRSDPSYGVGHVFLFLYGLEHRLFKEERYEAGPAFIREVERLLNVYGTNNSFKGYATTFLNAAKIVSNVPLKLPQPSPERAASTEMDMAVRLHLGKQLAGSPKLGAEDALLWALAMSDVYLRTPAVRCFTEFVSLWEYRFEEKFRDGLEVQSAGKIRLEYRAASGAFEVGIRGPHERFPDVCQAPETSAILKKFVEACTDELDAFSRFVGRKPTERETMQAAILLPLPLQRDTSSSALRRFSEGISRILGENMRASTTMSKVLDVAGIDAAEDGKVPTKIADQLSQALDQIGIAIEPDRRYGGGVPQATDQVFLFKAARSHENAPLSHRPPQA